MGNLMQRPKEKRVCQLELKGFKPVKKTHPLLHWTHTIAANGICWVTDFTESTVFVLMLCLPAR